MVGGIKFYLHKRVEIITRNGPVPGVIGSIPPHLLTDEQRKKPMEIKNMLIDIGADDKEDAIKIGIKPGQTDCTSMSIYTDGKSERKLWQKHGIIVMAVD